LTGVTKSGSVRECREALEELYEFLLAHKIGNPNSIHSVVDKFTEADLMDQVELRSNTQLGIMIFRSFIFGKKKKRVKFFTEQLSMFVKKFSFDRVFYS